MSRTQIAFTLLGILALIGWGSWWLCSAECSRLGRRLVEVLRENAERPTTVNVRANAMTPQVLGVLARLRANRTDAS